MVGHPHPNEECYGVFHMSFRALAWESSVAKYGIFNNSHEVRISLLAKS